ncbi:TauD/TfdA family dioxygenase [Streptomyces lunaelactis]|uniref:TauD/TfdA family dioxygenase n=1 Tax=Streptomyces lunaelactis TaxID=1535768 RepID=UPI001584F835|nr:TauD/TfdA family dioxygenase [Streptomyces lunaelactis]NUK33736.1 TauD/TfdA family dioxygenase [Streptomyces lunaelactis]
MTDTTSSPPLVESALVESTVSLTGAQHDQVRAVADELARTAGGLIDGPGWLTAARAASQRLPRELRQELREFRHDAGPDGLLLIRNLPVEDDLPSTPVRPGSVRRTATVASSAVTAVMLQLGEVIAFRSEKSGALVQDVVPVPGHEKQQSNAGSVALHMHTENAFHPNRPHYVGLMCVRADPTGDARLCTSSVRRALPPLTSEARRGLSEDRFMTEPPPSFGDLGGVTPVHPVLRGDPADPDVTVDFAATHPLDDGARRAMEELREIFERIAHPHDLGAGDLAVVDNRLTVHGRTSFTPRFDGTDRWLHRVYAALDRRRIRPDSEGGGAVLR